MPTDKVAEFTPGPWVVEKSEASSTGSVHYAVKTAYKPKEHEWSPRFIVFMCGGLGDFHPSRNMNDYRSDPGIEADAHLVAAAPEMYALLSDFLRNYEFGAEVDEEIAAVLAKAEGKQRAVPEPKGENL